MRKTIAPLLLLLPLTLLVPACDDSDCGNGLLDRGEECDDGNLQAGDGCDQYCAVGPGFRLSHKCGNGYTEVLLGEQCDDGNVFNGDGCSQHCLVENGYRVGGAWRWGPRPYGHRSPYRRW